MTSRSIKRLRQPSDLRPTSASAPREIQLAYRRWSYLTRLYLDWDLCPEQTRGQCPVHLPWVQSFDQFLSDMGPCPSANRSLGRDDPSLPYQPGNCYWNWGKRQGRPPVLKLTHQGETRSVNDWCRLLRMNYSTVYARIRRGVSPAVALGLTQECG